jgi:hypothetical protein
LSRKTHLGSGEFSAKPATLEQELTISVCAWPTGQDFAQYPLSTLISFQKPHRDMNIF